MCKKPIILLAVFMMISVGVIGCTTAGGNLFDPETALDQNWGRSYETAKYMQIQNPDAGARLEPVEGLGAVPVNNELKKYEDSFKAPYKEQTALGIKTQ